MSRTTLLILSGSVTVLLIATGLIFWWRGRGVMENSPVVTLPQKINASSSSTQTELVLPPTRDVPVVEELQRTKKSVENVKQVDQDVDGLLDQEESRYGTDVKKFDTDGDGVSDGAEVKSFSTDPLKKTPETDFQSVIDRTRDPVERFLLQISIEGIGHSSAVTTTPPVIQDSDGDGLTDEQEKNAYRTDPQKIDTDGDTYPDADEIKNGYNPLGSGKCATINCIP